MGDWENEEVGMQNYIIQALFDYNVPNFPEN